MSSASRKLAASSVLTWRAFTGEAPGDTIKEGFRLERLSEKALGADRYRFVVQLPVRQSGDQDYWCHNVHFAKLSYEVESAHSGHVNVGDHDVEKRQVGRSQERLSRGKRLSAI